MVSRIAAGLVFAWLVSQEFGIALVPVADQFERGTGGVTIGFRAIAPP